MITHSPSFPSSPQLADELNEAEKLTINDYMRGANRTSAPITDEMVKRMNQVGPRLANLLLNIAPLCAELDEIKKFVFYGRIPEDRPHADMLPGFPEQPCWVGRDCEEDSTDLRMHLLHAIIGLLTEVGDEMVTAILDEEKGEIKDDLDIFNLMEEFGDASWYIAESGLATGLPIGLSMLRNLKKLKARYPDKFTDEHAVNRDLKLERRILETGV